MLAAPGCFLFDKSSDAQKDDGKAKTGGTSGGGGAEKDPGDGGAANDVARATAELADIKAKGEVALYYERKDIRSIFALTGTVVTPSWAAKPTGELQLLRDDDWLTGVDCLATEAAPCAVGLTFAIPADVRALSLHAALGPKWRDYTSRPRPKTIRLHFDTGYVDAKVSDGPSVRWVVLDKAVKTKSIAIEFIDAQGKAAGKPLRINEFEVYGAAGPAREPIEIDLARARFYYESERWKSEGSSHEIRPSYLETVNAEGVAKRVASATAVYGEPTDRVLLFETLRKTNCTAHDGGSYVLLDRQTRLWLDVGRMGGLHRQVWRNTSGLGFAIGNYRDTPTDLPSAVLIEDEVLTRKRIGKTGPKGGSVAAQMELWGMADAPVAGDRAGDLAHPPVGCVAATADDLTGLTTEFAALGDASTWMRCSLASGGELLVHQASTCPGPWAYLVRSSNRAVIANKVGPATGRAIRVASHEDGSYWLEIDQDAGNKGKLLQVNADGTVAEPVSGAGFSLRMPGACDCNGVAPVDPNAPDGGDAAGATGGESGDGVDGEAAGIEPNNNLDGGDEEPNLGDDGASGDGAAGLPDVEDEP